MPSSPFGEKLELVLKVLSISRARLAADLGVDKSVVGRWAGGGVRPSEHNLAALTRYLAGRLPGFTMLDWDRELAEFAGAIGAELPGPEPELLAGLPILNLAQIRETSEARAADFEGFIQTTRPAERAPGIFFHDQGMVRRAANGLLEIRLGIGEIVFTGWALPIRSQIFCITTEAHSGQMSFVIINSGAVPRPVRMDGIALAPSVGSMPGIAAVPIVLERVAELTGDREADDALFRERLALNPIAPPGSVPPEVVAQLTRTYGPEQLALGGDMVMHIAFHASLTR